MKQQFATSGTVVGINLANSLGYAQYSPNMNVSMPLNLNAIPVPTCYTKTNSFGISYPYCIQNDGDYGTFVAPDQTLSGGTYGSCGGTGPTVIGSNVTTTNETVCLNLQNRSNMN